MSPRAALPLIALALLTATPSQPRPGDKAQETPAPRAASSPIRGVCFVASGRLEGDPFAPIRALGAGWISQTPFAWQTSADTPSLRLAASGRILWGESDDGLRETTRRARAAGLKTLLNPHIWLLERGKWRGDIAMRSEADWKAWFDQYRGMILHYAALAKEEGIEALSVGTELMEATRREADWRALIAEVRKVYPGRLTYAANWYEEADSIAFWDALDWIGVQAYYPLATTPDSPRSAVLEAWERRGDSLAKLSARVGRPIVFTEAGYRSQKGSLVEPWVWSTPEAFDPSAQALGFEALFRAVWNKPWFGGVFVWKWFPGLAPAGAPGDGSFTPQGKPAEVLIRRWFLHDGGESRAP